MAEQNLLLILVFLPFLGALAAATLPSDARNAAAWVSALTMGAGLAILIGFHSAVSGGRVLRATVDWVPSLGLELTYRIDGFAWFFTTLVLGIGVLIVIYARSSGSDCLY